MRGEVTSLVSPPLCNGTPHNVRQPVTSSFPIRLSSPAFFYNSLRSYMSFIHSAKIAKNGDSMAFAPLFAETDWVWAALCCDRGVSGL